MTFNPLWLPGLALATTLAAAVWNAYRHPQPNRQRSAAPTFWMAAASVGLLAGTLTQQGVTHYHLPPTRIEQSLTALALLGLLEYLIFFKTWRTIPAVSAAALLTLAAAQTAALIMAYQPPAATPPPLLGPDPLWGLVLPGRWLLLAALAGLLWLAWLAAFGWGATLPRFNLSAKPVAAAEHHLRRWIPPVLPAGATLLLTGQTWAGATVANIGLNVTAALLLYLAAEWLRLGPRPTSISYRPATIAAFAASIPLLFTIL